MNMYKTFFLFFFIALLTGCNTTPSRPNIAAEIEPLEFEVEKIGLFSPPSTSYSDYTDSEPLNEGSVDTNKEDALSPQQLVLKLRGQDEDFDLWYRLREGYELQEHENRNIKALVDYYSARPRYFSHLAKQAAPYLYHIVEEVEERGLPLELALLPAVESTFNPMALSHVKAAGIWQFMPRTGRHFGLKQNKWYDGRRDIIASTNAALDYLEYLYRFFGNDWLNALAAYNYGEGNLARAIRKNKARGRPTDFWSLDLPEETRKFVPKLLALSKIVANPEDYGITLKTISDEPHFTQIDVGKQINLSMAAKIVGLSKRDFKRLNPAFKRSTTAPQGPHCVSVPVGKEDVFRQNIAKLAKLPALQAKSKRLSSTAKVKNRNTKKVRYTKYRIKRGDTLAKIAKRYRISTREIKKLNPRLNSRNLKIGKIVKVPNTRVTKRKTKKTNKRLVHTVKSGDNLWTIARHYSVSVASISRWNRLASNALHLGQKLTIKR